MTGMNTGKSAGRPATKNWIIRALVLASIGIGVAALLVSCANDRVYVASGHPEWAPLMYRDGNLISGAAAELVQKIAADLGFKIKTEYAGNWDEVQAKAKKGEVDLLVAAYKTAERQTYMDYSVAYTVDPIVIYVKKGTNFNYYNWGDLIGKKGVLTVGDSYGQAFDGFIEERLSTVRVNTVAEAYDMVKNGRAYYFVYAVYSGEKFLAKNGLAGEFEVIPKSVASEDFFITISKKSPLTRYLNSINDELEKYKRDGTINSLIDKYRAGYLNNK
jgi:polar amino acid transport system substrate-binding protein